MVGKAIVEVVLTLDDMAEVVDMAIVEVVLALDGTEEVGGKAIVAVVVELLSGSTTLFLLITVYN